MCIAIYKPRGVTISVATLKECFDSNPDGAGFMFSENGNLTILKGFFDFPSFYLAYKKHEEKLCVIHFRIKTHGKIDITNCHPFQVTPQLAFVHNGIISGFGTADLNDTYMFNEEILKAVVRRGGKKLLFNPAIVKLIEKAIGHSKLIFLDNYGKFKIFNEFLGEWNEGVWYSNTSYKPAPIYHYKNNKSNRYDSTKVTPIEGEGGFFVKKPDYQQDIHDMDWVKTNASCRGISKGTIAYVEKVNGNGFCDLVFTDGSTIKQFPGSFLDYIDWEINEDMILLQEY